MIKKKTLGTAKTIQDLESLKKEPDFDINQNFPGKKNALFTAGIEKSKWLIENNINVNKIDSKSQNALFYATTPEKLNLLLESGLNINRLSMFNYSFLYTITPNLISYVFSDDFKYDISNIINIPDNKKLTFLQYAFNEDKIKEKEAILFIQQFVKKGGDVLFKNKRNISILNFTFSKPELFIYLLENFNFENIDQNYTETTSWQGTFDTQNLLCSLFSKKDSNTKESLDYLFEHKNKEFMNMIHYINTSPQTKNYISYANEYVSEKERKILNITINKNTEKNIKRL